MGNAHAKPCPRCGSLIDAATGGHCLHCLLALALPQSTEPVSDNEPTLEQVGSYNLIRQIGEGGCGVVYEAEQIEPVRRRVALKIIKLGMDTRSVVARFEAEKQALAVMDHPNIAKVFDAGATAHGRPYFVMELVEGAKITDYCDAKKLSVSRRLELFVQICLAIQHAHQRGIIHRDIKPSNILVAEDEQGSAIPKIIDFGIAKATTGQSLADKTCYTAFEQFIGTPAYMSPEQAGFGALEVDTRTDVYSLGVLLYELLAGKPPFEVDQLRRQALDEVVRFMRDYEPPAPSARLTTLEADELEFISAQRNATPLSLPRYLRCDLDWIVLKALQKPRDQRYESPAAFARDVELFLAQRPIHARPPSLSYRLSKWLRRNHFAVTLFISVALLVCLSAFYSAQWIRGRLQARRIRLQQSAAVEMAARVKTFIDVNGTKMPVYNLESDFSATNNPNGVWSYTYSEWLNGPQHIYTAKSHYDGMDFWYNAGNNPPQLNSRPIPELRRDAVLRGWDGESVSAIKMHPGPNSEFSHIVWTAPASGSYYVEAAMALLSPRGHCEVYVIHRTSGNAPLLRTKKTLGYWDKWCAWTANVNVNIGDQLDFGLGADNIDSTTTAFSVLIHPNPKSSATVNTNVVDKR